MILSRTGGSRAAFLAVVAALAGLGGCSSTAVSPVPTTSSPSSAAPTADSGVGDVGHWQPTGTMQWHIQYGGDDALTPDVPVFNLDGDFTSAKRVEELHQLGAKVICYFDAGAIETYRDDVGSFPEALMGNPVDGWPDELWLDVRQLDVLLPLMERRIQVCLEKGFDAVDPDLMNGFTADTGFPLTQTDAVNYQRGLIDLAHERGLGIGLKNTMELIPELADEIDFAVNEQCLEYDECGTYDPLVALNKPVFHIEYQGATCKDQPEGFSTVLAELPLDGPITNCR